MLHDPRLAGPGGASIRELGAIERLFFTMDENRSTHFVMALVVPERVEASAWRSALRAVQARHPLLSCRIAAGGDGRPAFHRVPDAEIPVRIADASSTWTIEAERELARPFDTSRAPLLRAASIGGTDRTVLLIAAHHAVADGRSILFVMRDLLAALSGETLVPLAPIPPREDLIDRLPRPRQGEPDLPPEGAPQEPNRYVAPGTAPRVSDLQLDAELTAALRARARREATTVHGALCAALARATHAGPDGWRSSLCVGSPIDIRARLGVGDDCALMLSPGLATCGSGALGDFWALARSMRDQTAEGGDPARIRAGAAGLNALFSTDPDAATVAAMAAAGFGQALVTNLGPVPFDHPRVEAVRGPALLMGFDGVPTVGAVTAGGRLRLTVSSFGPMPDLLPAMEEDLRAATS